jgi:hypothetical protein
VHVCIDDHSRLAYVEVLDDERGIHIHEVITATPTSRARGLHGVRNTRSGTSASAPAVPAPTEKRNDSSRPCSANGPTRRPIAPANTARWHSHPGSTTTTIDDHTAPSVTNHQPHGYPPAQRGWDLQLAGTVSGLTPEHARSAHTS